LFLGFSKDHILKDVVLLLKIINQKEGKMGFVDWWKKLKYWQRGGIIAISLILINLIIIFWNSQIKCVDLLCGALENGMILSFIYIIVIYYFLVLLIKFIVDRIKKKNYDK